MKPTAPTANPATSDNPLSLVRPSWADPSYLMRAAYSRLSTVTVTSSNPQVMLRPDPRRIAVIVPAQQAVALGVVYGPTLDLPQTYIGNLNDVARVFTIFDWLTLVTDGWYVISPSGATTFPVIEILTQ